MTGRWILPFVMASGFIADTASLPFVISNLVNILSADFFAVGFVEYASRMLVPTMVSVAASLAVLFLVYRWALPESYEPDCLQSPQEAIRDPRIFRMSWIVLGGLLAAYSSEPLASRSVSSPARSPPLAAHGAAKSSGGCTGTPKIGSLECGRLLSGHVHRRLWPAQCGVYGLACFTRAEVGGKRLVRGSHRHGLHRRHPVLGDEQPADGGLRCLCDPEHGDGGPAAGSTDLCECHRLGPWSEDDADRQFGHFIMAACAFAKKGEDQLGVLFSHRGLAYGAYIVRNIGKLRLWLSVIDAFEWTVWQEAAGSACCCMRL